jgi:hypothetical protein
MRSGRGRAAGRGDLHAEVTPGDAHETAMTSEDERDLAELEAEDDEVRPSLWKGAVMT